MVKNKKSLKRFVKKKLTKKPQLLKKSLKKPLKAKNLKVIDHLGMLYATFDGSSLWQIDKAAFLILQMCDGKKSIDQIAKDVSKKISQKPKDVRPVIEEVLNSLTKSKFIVWV